MFAKCERCGKSWSVLQDGTLTEHPQLECTFLLCTGSRTRAVQFVLDKGDDTPCVPLRARKRPRVLVAAN